MDKKEETYHMTDREMTGLIVANRLRKEEITVKDAEVLRLSVRQVKRIKKGVKLNGKNCNYWSRILC